MKFKPYKKHIIIITILVMVLILFAALKSNAYISEYIFARGISRLYIQCVGAVTSLLPFSLYEILITAAAVAIAVILIKTIKNLNNKHYQIAVKRLMSLCSVILCCVLLYNLTASFSYSRQPLELSLNKEKPQSEEVFAAAQYFLNDYNAIAEQMQRDGSGNIVPPYSINELSAKLQNEYKKYAPEGYTGSVMRAKPMLYSEIMSYLGFSGVFMSVTAEPNINRNIPPKSLPVVCAHEMAHSAGVMNESEANLLAYYVLLNSDDYYLRYSVYGETFYQMLAAVLYSCGQEKYSELYSTVNPLILQENKNASNYWEKYKSFLQDISKFFNDTYLKLSGVKEGIKSYDNPYEIIDTGEKEEETGEVIYEISYSKVQYMYFTIYAGTNQN